MTLDHTRIKGGSFPKKYFAVANCYSFAEVEDFISLFHIIIGKESRNVSIIADLLNLRLPLTPQLKSVNSVHTQLSVLRLRTTVIIVLYS